MMTKISECIQFLLGFKGDVIPTIAPLSDTLCCTKYHQITRGIKMELKENVKEKLAEAVELWADENLIGKPAVLANAIYFSLEKVLIEKAKEIQEKF